MSSEAAPLHLAIIPDGNRRWAKAKGLRPWKGHEEAMKRIQEISDWCQEDKRIDILTLWLFSTENWKRDPVEIAELMKLLQKELQAQRKKFMKEGVRLRHAGRKDRLPPALATLITEIEAETAGNERFTLQLAIDYGGKDELVRAINRSLTSRPPDLKTFSEETLSNFLDQPDLQDIDLVIRTSGENRTSNFFLWQSAYAEWIFSAKNFPDFKTEDLAAAVTEYEERQRRFGT
ncbi:MAG TPA: polyprenyl diphosphate synthase [Candidatus Peribacteraceae bacterium]|nr:polyprenyl diphosphate synthase [Candidatus Peribacteraceae bacterium]